MKKLLIAVLALVMLMTVSSCGHTKTEGRVALPIKGHFSVIGDIIVETDKISVSDEVIPNARAFTYKDGEFYQLKRYETDVTIPKDYIVNDKDFTLPVQYFICRSTVYAYPNRSGAEMGGFHVETIPVPQNDECVIMQCLELSPLFVNVKSGKITPIFDDDKQDVAMPGKVICVSEDGEYAAVLGARQDEMVPKCYLLNLKNFDMAEIPLPAYDEERYKYKSAYPSVLADGRLYVNYTLTELDIDGGETVGTFFYDLKKKQPEKLAAPLTDYTVNEQYPYIMMEFEHETGVLKVKNLKDVTDYFFSVYPSNGLWGMPNKTGQYVVGTHFNLPIAGYDENGRPYYENNPQNQQHITLDLKNQRRIDLLKIDSKFQYTTYDGLPCINQWISETELLISCYDAGEEHIRTVINVGGNEA